MEPVSLTISLITLCKELYTAIQSIKNAREDIKAFSEELAALQRTLESVHKAFGGKQSSVLSKLETEIRACLTKLNKLAIKVKPDGWRARLKNTFNRSAWPLKEVETRQYIDQIYRLTSHLGLELQAYQTTMAAEETVKQENEREKEERRRRDEKRFEILRWIHPENCNDRHVHIRSQRKQGTGQWLFETPGFQQWMGKESSRVLLGSGIAGAGKTFLSSVVIDHLSERPSHDGVAYLYFGYQDRSQQRPIDVFSIFTRQLVSQLPELPPDILELHSNKGTESPDLEMLRRLLFSMPKRFSNLGRRVFIVCDALDEMDEHQQRDVLLPLFHDMEDAGFEIFLTSRPHPEDVRRSFAAAIQLELTPHYGDLHSYVEEKITASPKTKKMIENSQSLRLENVISAVASSAEGMFLLAHLNAIHICQQATASDISRELKQVKVVSTSREKQLEVVYRRAIHAIDESVNSERALRVLSWLSNATRPLKVEELRAAVSVEKESRDLGNDSLPSKEGLADICAGLAIVEENTNTVRLIHYTTQEYLQRKSMIPAHLQPTSGYHAAVCATYLSFNVFKVGACLTQEDFARRIREHAFLLYAAENFFHHVRHSDEIFTADAISGVLDEPASITSYLQARESYGFSWGFNRYKQGYHAIHVVSELGHEIAARRLMEDDHRAVSCVSEDGRTPLHFASEVGNVRVALLLIDCGAEVSTAAKDGQTPLHMAAFRGDEATVQLLLDRGAEVSTADKDGATPSDLAAKRGFEHLSLLLRDSGTTDH